MCLRVVHSCSLQITRLTFLRDVELIKFSSLHFTLQALVHFDGGSSVAVFAVIGTFFFKTWFLQMSQRCEINSTSQKQREFYFQLRLTCSSRLWENRRWILVWFAHPVFTHPGFIPPQLLPSMQAFSSVPSSQWWSCALWILSPSRCRCVGPRRRPCPNLWDWILLVLKPHPTLSALSLVSRSVFHSGLWFPRNMHFISRAMSTAVVSPSPENTFLVSC